MKHPRNVDRLVWFCLPPEDRQFLEQYMTPGNKASVFRGIPVEHKERVKDIVLRAGMRLRLVYRGPRKHQRMPTFTRENDAKKFSLYDV